MFRMIAGVATMFAGCAVQPQSSPALGYVCDDGREFSLSVSSTGETANIEIARMDFALVADSPTGAGEQFSCGVLTLRRLGNMASVEMDGLQQFSNCRIKP